MNQKDDGFLSTTTILRMFSIILLIIIFGICLQIYIVCFAEKENQDKGFVVGYPDCTELNIENN